ncbi:MAG: bifunctional oligoribonuclease and phosphatase NrnA, partial [Thermoleophilaceae bacterium]|nr:bifunctional oligoribonuclease and phosphatase NrnA [Thermoleophilaceae bacterium]
MSVAVELDAVVEELRSAQKFLLTTHENPDGDALGSLLGMHGLLRQLGKDSCMFLAADEFPLPWEYRDMPLDEVKNEPPADLDARTVVFLDCGNIDRMPVDFLQRDGVHIVNVDHHHDNTRFGTVNLVDSRASCTAEIVWDLAKELGAEITPAIGDALYVGLVTDTGKFMYTNTSPRSHRMAAELIEAGVDAHAIYRRLYEELPFARLQLLSRALNAIERFDEGVVTATSLTRADFEETGAVETDSEGIVDHLRSVQGTKVAVLVRELLAEDRSGVRKVSLRSTDG